MALGAVPVQFLPDSGTQQIYGTVDLPPGTSTERARALLEPLEERLGAISGVESHQIAYGEGGVFEDPSLANGGVSFFATLEEGASAPRAVDGLRSFGDEEYPDGFTVQRIEQGPPSQLEITVSGERRGQVLEATRRIDELLGRARTRSRCRATCSAPRTSSWSSSTRTPAAP